MAGLFAGIGGIELGLEEAGHRTEFVCEIEESARAVLAQHVAGKPFRKDVRRLRALPKCDLLAAGFPCQDLSQAGRTAGIGGRNSGLIQSVFELIRTSRHRPTWLLLENVPFMLQLDRGRGMEYLASALEDLGFQWAYRVVDARAFGLPQRRQRVLLLASQTEDPREVLFAGNHDEPDWGDATEHACGFYWTEGLRGLGWAVDAVPTLKGGSTIGIPSPPAIRMPDGSIVLPDIRDAERLQGFAADWTKPAEDVKGRKGARWKLVGNAVCVPVARWLGQRLADPGPAVSAAGRRLSAGERWPGSAWGNRAGRYEASCTPWPACEPREHLETFLRYPTVPLSVRAAEGFLSRANRSGLNFPPRLLDDVRAHLTWMRHSRGDETHEPQARPGSRVAAR